MCSKSPEVWFNHHQQWATSKMFGQDLSIRPLFGCNGNSWTVA